MLQNKSYNTGDITCFKLVNGDEVVAKIVDAHLMGWTVN